MKSDILIPNSTKGVGMGWEGEVWVWSPIQDIVLIFFDPLPNANLLIGLGTKTSKFFSSLSAPFLHLYFCLWDALSFHQCHCQRKDVPSLDGSASWRCDTNFSAIYIIPVLFITIVWNIPRSSIFCQFFKTSPFLSLEKKLLNKKQAPQKNQNFTQMHWWLGSGNCRRVTPGRMPLTRFWT